MIGTQSLDIGIVNNTLY